MPEYGGFSSGGVAVLANESIVAASGGQFTSVKSALDFANSVADVNHPQLVHVSPGLYYEPPLLVGSYVTIEGEGAYLVPTNHFAHFITGSPLGEVARIHLVGPNQAGFATINYEGEGNDPFKIEDTEINGGYYGIWCHPVNYGLLVCSGILNINSGEVTGGFLRCTGHGELRASSCTYRQQAPILHCAQGYVADGVDAYMTLDTCIFKDAGGTDAYYANNGAYLRMSGCTSSAAINCIHVGPNGNSIVNSLSTVIRPSHTWDILTDTPTAVVQFSGAAHSDKLSISGGVGLTASFSDEAGGAYGGQVNIGEFYLNDATGNSIPVKDYLQFSGNTGLATGGEVTRSGLGGLNVDIAEGEAFISLSGEAGILEYYWNDTPMALTSNKRGWIIVNSAGTLEEVFASPDTRISVVLADFVTSATNVTFLASKTVGLYQSLSDQHQYAGRAMGPLSVSGVLATKNAPVSTKLNVDGGTFYLNNIFKTATDHDAVTFTGWYKNAANAWVAVPGMTDIDTTNYNLIGTGLQAMTGGWYSRPCLYTSVNASGTEYHVVYGQYENVAAGGCTTLPTPPDWLQKGSLRTASVIVQQGVADMATPVDERPVLGQLSTGGTAVTSHHGLGDLEDGDDHPQYQLRTEKGAISGYCGLDVTQKVAAGNLHLTSTHPVDITAGLSSEGVSTEIARQDHLHSHGNLAAVDSGLVALHSNAVAGVTPGFISAANQTKLDGLAITHASRHAAAGADPLTPAAIGAYTTVESDTRDLLRQGGLREDPTYTDHHDGTVTVDPLTAVLFSTSDYSDHPEQYILPAVLHAPPEGKSYIVGDYNGGGPGVPTQKVITDVDLITESTVIPVFTVYRDGANLELLSWDTTGRGLANKIHQRLVKTSRFQRESGFTLSETAGRVVNILTGRAWYGAAKSEPGDFDSVGHTMVLFKHVAGVWTEQVVTQYDNTQWDNGTDLQPLSVGKYGVNWVYRCLAQNCDRSYIVLGGGDYNDTEAHVSQPPVVPTLISSLSILVGRIIVQQGQPTAHAIESAFDILFSGVPIQDHNDLAELNTGDYQHLTAVQLSGLTGGVSTALHSHSIYAAAATTLTAGAGLTGGGDLSADRTFTIAANADGSITVNANDIQVGTLATDAQHGNLGNGTLHTVAVAAGNAGFMSGADKTKLDSVASNAAALTAASPVNVTKSAAVVGDATLAARANHKHDVDTAAPGTVTFLAAATEGSATSLARSDHSHALTLPAAPANVTKAAASAGSSANVAREDHKHDVDTAAPSTIGTSNTEGNATSLARSNHVHDHGAQTVDTQHALVVAATSHGFMSKTDKTKLDGLITNATPTTTTLTAGAGLTGGGDLSADRTFTVVANADGSITVNADDIQVGILASDAQHGNRGGGGIHANVIAAGASGFMTGADKTKLDGIAASAAALTSDAPENVTKAAAVVGDATLAARANHKHDVTTAAPSTIGTSNTEGNATSLARSNHIHDHGSQTVDTQHALVVAATSHGFMSSSDKTKLDGIAASAAALTAVAPVNVTKAAAVVGDATLAARANHKHDISTDIPGSVTIAAVADEGAATSLARSDHTHGVGTPAAPANVTKAAANTGASSTPARADHKHDVTTAAPAAAGVGTISGEGSATSLARSDHSHQSNTAPVDVTKVAAVTGTSTEPARADHKHDVTTAVPSTIGTSNIEGAATSLARSNHVHDHGDQTVDTQHALVVAATSHGFMDKADKTKLDAIGVYGQNYQTAISLARTTYNTNTAFQNKVTLTTPALAAGTYEVSWTCVLDGSATNQNVETQLYNTTDAAIVGVVQVFRPTNSAERNSFGGFAEVPFAGVAKTFNLQYRTANTGSTVGIADARVKIIRVS